MSLKNTMILCVLIMSTVVACNDAPKSSEASTATDVHQHADHQKASSETAKTTTPKIGDLVPSDLVCMVNNQYMGVEQLVVNFEGKTYYGCCEMCQKRIPTEPKVRVAVDPYSKEKVDKADAVIAITGERGEVSYFENKENYKKYMAAARS